MSKIKLKDYQKADIEKFRKGKFIGSTNKPTPFNEWQIGRINHYKGVIYQSKNTHHNPIIERVGEDFIKKQTAINLLNQLPLEELEKIVKFRKEHNREYTTFTASINL